MTKPVGEEERGRIVAMLREKTPYAVAKEVGRSRPTVSKIAREAGIDVNVNATKKAAEARSAYAESRRLEIIGKGLDKADALLSSISDAGEFQKWTVGFGTLIDKARLETGEVTDRTESRRGDASLEEEFKRLDADLEAEGAKEGAP